MRPIVVLYLWREELLRVDKVLQVSVPAVLDDAAVAVLVLGPVHARRPRQLPRTSPVGVSI